MKKWNDHIRVYVYILTSGLPGVESPFNGHDNGRKTVLDTGKEIKSRWHSFWRDHWTTGMVKSCETPLLIWTFITKRPSSRIHYHRLYSQRNINVPRFHRVSASWPQRTPQRSTQLSADRWPAGFFMVVSSSGACKEREGAELSHCVEGKTTNGWLKIGVYRELITILSKSLKISNNIYLIMIDLEVFTHDICTATWRAQAICKGISVFSSRCLLFRWSVFGWSKPSRF